MQSETQAPQAFRVMLASIECAKGDPRSNLETHLRVLRESAAGGCHMVVFPEMSLSGSVDPKVHPEHLLHLDSEPVKALVECTQVLGVSVVFGIAEVTGTGEPHITQVYAVHGHVAGAYRKRHLGKDEKGFAQGTVSAIFQFGSLRFGIAICAEGEVDYPFDEPARDGAALVMFCAAPGLHRRRTDDESWRAGLAWWESEGLEHARRHALRTGEWVLLATQAGSTVDEDFPGLSAAVSPDGTVVARLPDWRSGLLTVDIPVGFEVEPVRHAARVLVFDEEGRVLLVQFSDVRGHSWWAAPGGGLDEGEDHRGAAARELGEELGRDDIELGPQIGWRSHTLSFNGQPWMTQRENWFMATHAHFEISSEQKELLQVEHVTDIAWWSAGELLSEGVVTAPRHLAETVAQIAAGNAPPPEQDLGV